MVCRGQFFAATLVAYVAVSPIINVYYPFFSFRLGIEDVLDLLHELIHLGGFGVGGLFGAHCLEALVWKHPGNTPEEGEIHRYFRKNPRLVIFFFHGLNYNAHPFVKFFVFT